MVDVTLPSLGESVTEGSIVEWRKRAGDWVDAGDPIVEGRGRASLAVPSVFVLIHFC